MSYFTVDLLQIFSHTRFYFFFAMLKKIIYFFLTVFSLLCLTGVGTVVWLVIVSPGEAVRQENIEKILSMESPVFCSDGKTKIGVFFQESHRQYIPYERMPKFFIDAIVASEDQKFWRHYGLDFQGLIRAMKANVKAGRVVQGGSTITQQTAKNLFRRQERTVRAKLVELINAWRLEYHYSKEKILEFYANQFFVSGNGHGLGVAARYYFDKPASELGLLEAAFIAGSVKRPNFYNPFVQKNEEERATARQRAKERTDYVLAHMYKLGMIDSKDYQQALEREIPFKLGQMQFPLNTVMDMVKDGLADPEIETVLFEHGINNIATAGLRVITSIENDLQQQTMINLRYELSRLDVRLRGYDRKTLQKRYAKLPFGAEAEPVKGDFLVGRVVRVDPVPSPVVEVVLGREDDPTAVKGVIDARGLRPLLDSLVKYEKQRWTEADDDDFALLLERIKAGDLVYVSLGEHDALSGKYFFELQKYPELQGAVIALRDGMVRAMAGGMENYFYNRAVMAQRPLGSVIKPLVYCAALQLGWNSVEPLNNARQMFLYQDEAYFPRPDHASPYQWVSMSWAGVHSENVASVWLLYHLCDHLSPGQFKDLVTNLGLARGREESYPHYQRRIRDQLGIVVNEAALRRAAFVKAVTMAEADLIFASRQREWENLAFFYYDDDFEYELENDDQTKETEIRREILKKSFLRFAGLREEIKLLGRDYVYRREGFIKGLYYQPLGVRLTRLDDEKLLAGSRFVYSETYPGPGWEPVRGGELVGRLADLPENQRQTFWDNIQIEGLLSSATIDLIQNYVEAEYRLLAAAQPYSAEVLYHVRDFRILAGLKYLAALSRALGVKSRLEPVLSFPLGSNVISLLEAARMYEGMIFGQVSRRIDCQNEGVNIISRIESSEGEIIYQAADQTRTVVDPHSSLAVTDILRNVVKYGTGSYAADNIKLHSSDPEKEELLSGLNLTVPVLGKTGTANRFTNAAFVGLAPSRYAGGNGVALPGATVLAAYVGFDDNSPMTRSSTHITGAGGALPLWAGIVNELFVQRDYAQGMDLVDLTFSSVTELPLWYHDVGQIEIAVRPLNGGLPLEHGEEAAAADVELAPVVTFGEKLSGGRVRLERQYLPFWRVGTEQLAADN